MNIYKRLYYMIFNAMTDTIEALEYQNYGRAIQIMKKAQQEAEERFMKEEEEL